MTDSDDMLRPTVWHTVRSGDNRDELRFTVTGRSYGELRERAHEVVDLFVGAIEVDEMVIMDITPGLEQLGGETVEWTAEVTAYLSAR